MRAIELLVEGRSPEAVAAALGCARSSVYAWAKAWREMGLSGLQEGPRSGRKRSLEGRAELLLEGLLEEGDPQRRGYHSTGWTAPMLKERARKGWLCGERAHGAPDAKEVGLSLEASEIRARQTRSRLRE